MKITKETKFLMQLNSFVGMVAAASLMHMGVHSRIAWAGLIVNGVCLIIWCFAKEDNEQDRKDSE